MYLKVVANLSSLLLPPLLPLQCGPPLASPSRRSHEQAARSPPALSLFLARNEVSIMKVTTRSPIYLSMFGGRTGAALVDGHPTQRLPALPFVRLHRGMGAIVRGGNPQN